MIRTGSHGYTLLEVILSLVLTSLVLLCVAMAVDFQLRIANAGRTHVEEAQLARVLLHRIADDLRGAVIADPLGLDKLVPSITVSYGSTPSPDTGDSQEALPEETQKSTSDESKTTEDQVTDPTQGRMGHPVPGLYGGADWVQLDVDRPGGLAHGLNSSSGNGSSSSEGPTGDLKTVAYYVVAPDASTASAGSQTRGGLLRRELDRAVTDWVSEQGSSGQLLLGEKLLAPEVASLRFRYSDGSAWSESWDTAQTKNLPLAVEITLTLQPLHRQGDWATALASSTGMISPEEQEKTAYRLVVDIPMARAKTADETETDSENTDMESLEMENETPPTTK